MKSSGKKWIKHFNSLPTETLIEIVAIGYSAHEDLIHRIIKERGVSNEELINKMEVVKHTQNKIDAEQMEIDEELEANEIFYILKWIMCIIVAAITMLSVFYSHILEHLTESPISSAQYAFLFVMIASAVLPAYIFCFFLRGGEIAVHMIFDEDESFGFFKNNVPKAAWVLAIMSLVILDSITTFSIVLISLCTTFLFMVFLSALTGSGAALFMREHVITIFKIGLLTETILFIFIIIELFRVYGSY
ncbi:hypothetical protein [Marinobacterium rhizophilum]|uniref:Uncharacterized protein n=1 Tax=Marinobacterium rhizophilum TaxID=420402 RepID=A0ABY5HP77_9GAMM|nr:hypothetical protein [Marinobacterium rhizophilum]UTW12696.1 hypothetical protein KDW95_03175 [Marinobacterium rhizophilum]